MIYIRLMGGLGNQMFQYAFGRRMALINNTELVLDQSLLLDKSKPNELVTHRDFNLDIFELQHFRWATDEEIFLYNGNSNASRLKKVLRKVKNILSPKTLIIQKSNEFNEQYLKIKSDVCFVGRWQSELYFKDVSNQIKNEFIIKNTFNDEIEAYKNIMNNCQSVCLHIRRGDLITSQLYNASIGTINWDYYERALSYIRTQIENPIFFIFSDDIDWCKQNINLHEKTHYMEHTTSGIKAEGHLYLMQQCKHFIISNSTFAWWGAWLSNEATKKVVYPKKWYKNEDFYNKHICPNSWISL